MHFSDGIGTAFFDLATPYINGTDYPQVVIELDDIPTLLLSILLRSNFLVTKLFSRRSPAPNDLREPRKSRASKLSSPETKTLVSMEIDRKRGHALGFQQP